ncbi:hypothetical protein DPMN_043160 [Dreissena polymorpha]|uniref:Uncharacterized protein n=1 Tax=Dreissena polymorpha TaxID=45954 RepID=A0A9D4D1R0_DREPO|nr:hypothetical protein DPMN_043160 [Dreissena polymorpha]
MANVKVFGRTDEQFNCYMPPYREHKNIVWLIVEFDENHTCYYDHRFAMSKYVLFIQVIQHSAEVTINKFDHYAITTNSAFRSAINRS